MPAVVFAAYGVDDGATDDGPALAEAAGGTAIA